MQTGVQILAAFAPTSPQRDRFRTIVTEGSDPGPRTNSDYLEKAVRHYLEGTRPYWARNKTTLKREAPLLPRLAICFYELYEERDRRNA